MKYSIHLLALLSLSVIAPLSAALLLHDNYSSAPGALPESWSADNYGTPNLTAINAKNNDLVSSGNLTVAGLAASTGGKWTHDNSAYQYYRREYAATPLALGETVYYSLVVQLDDISALNVGSVSLPLFGLASGTSTSMGNTVSATVGFSKDALDSTKFNITVDGDFRGPNNATSIKIPGQYSTRTPILIVGSYTRTPVASPNTSTASFWINPDQSSFGALAAPAATVTDVAANNSGIRSFIIASTTALSGQPNAWSLDELRIGDTWSDVTPSLATIPEPSSFAAIGGCFALLVVSMRRAKR